MLRILDTTLRDGEQTPGVSLTVEQKLIIAQALDDLGVDVIEAGTAIAGEEEFKAIKEIANAGLNAEICSFARIKEIDIDAVANADADSVFMVAPSSDIHIKTKFPNKSRDDIIEMSVRAVEYAKERGLIVEFGAEDSSRADLNFVKSLFKAVLDAGADRLTFTDTVGVLTPEKAECIMRELTSEFDVPIAFHGHNDFGLATANTIFAVKGGAREIHVTINGLGERAGNAPLEEVVLTLETFYGVKTKIRKEKIYDTSKLVEALTRFPIALNKPIVGYNAFMHESGIHTSALLRNAKAYEPIPPEMIGRKRAIVHGKHSGKASIMRLIEELGYEASGEQVKEIMKRIKEMEGKGQKVMGSDLIRIIEDVLKVKKGKKIVLKGLNVVCGKSGTSPHASIKISLNGEDVEATALGKGPFDASIRALKNALREYANKSGDKVIGELANVKLVNYKANAIIDDKVIEYIEKLVEKNPKLSGLVEKIRIMTGTDAPVDVIVQLEKDDRVVTAIGRSTDIIHASVEAYIECLNKLI
ncbi:2-isopropylmalate synthase [Archaeoglobus sp.]